MKSLAEEIKQSGLNTGGSHSEKIHNVDSSLSEIDIIIANHLNEVKSYEGKIKQLENELYNYKLTGSELKCKIENLNTLIASFKHKIEVLEYKNNYLQTTSM